MNKYTALYNRKWIEVTSDTSYHAQLEAAKRFGLKPSHAYKVTVTLTETPAGTVNINPQDV